MKILVVTEEEINKLLPMQECITVMTEALSSLARLEMYQPLRMVVRPVGARGLMALMPAYKAGENPAYGLKTICVFPENPARGKDAHQGSVALYDGETGEMLALMNASAITAIRTAAVSGVATRLLAREDANQLAIIGAGVQARSHLAAMSCVRHLNVARIASRTFEHALKLAEESRALYTFPVEAVASVEEALRGADLIVTATSAHEPVLKREWVAPGSHINAVGTYSPSAREIDAATVAASRLFVDRRESAVNEAGDYILAVEEGAIGPEHILGEIGEILVGDKRGRTSPEEITMFKSLGLAVEDLAAAQYVYSQAKMKGAGTCVEF